MKGLTYILELEEMTAAELAKKLKVSTSIVYRWANGSKSIPQERLEQMQLLFHCYPISAFEEDIDEMDKLNLQNIKKEYQIRNLNEDDPLKLIQERKRLQDEQQKNESLIEQQKLLENISLLFKGTYELDIASTSEVTFHKIVIKHFFDLCELEKKIITNFFENEDDAEAFKKSSQHITIDIKDFSAELEDSLKFCESLIKYKNK